MGLYIHAYNCKIINRLIEAKKLKFHVDSELNVNRIM